MIEIFQLHIPLIPPSLNKWYAGTHWKNRKRVADLWHDTVFYLCKEKGIQKIKFAHHSFHESPAARSHRLAIFRVKTIPDLKCGDYDHQTQNPDKDFFGECARTK